jgi:hypothetical protein
VKETSVHDLLHQAMSGQEPPLAAGSVVGRAVGAARKTRRRQLSRPWYSACLP